ncbi:MAG: aminotransferase class V-fold PLP-dependent enzyme [Actinomycetota bacterium]
MTLRHGRAAVSIPGPSVIPDRVLAAMHRPMPNIYEGELVDVAMSVLADLPAIARTTTAEPFIVIGNGHAAWQMAIDNTLNRGDRVLVLESGTFAVAWGDMARVSGVEVEVLPGNDHEPVDPKRVGERLARDTDHDIAAVLVVLADTASSCLNDIAAIRRAIDDAGHPALFMVDAIASLGCDRFEMDGWGVDLTVAASQKGLMVPPGIAMVWAGERAIEAYDRGTDLRSGYSDWGPRMRPEAFYQRFAGTPPISHIYGMREALDMIGEEGGLDAVWARHEILATAVWDAIDAWSTEGGVVANIADRAHRSRATTTVRTGSIDANELRRRAESDFGLTLGLGIGPDRDHRFRIGHMGHLNPPMLLGTIGTIEATLTSMGVDVARSGAAASAASIGRLSGA